MTYHHSFNPPICYGSEWDHFVDDEARARGIPSNDQQALEDGKSTSRESPSANRKLIE